MRRLLPVIGVLLVQAALLTAASGLSLAADTPGADYDSLFAQIDEARRQTDWPAVAALLERALQLNPTVARHWWELGLAREHARQYDAAIEAFERAHQLGGGFSWDPVFFVASGDALFHVAICQAALGRNDEAIAAAQRALDAGLRNPRRLITDSRLAALKNDERLRELAGAIPAGLSREEGLRADLKFLVREMYRLHFDPHHVNPPAKFQEEISRFEADIPTLSEHQAIVRFQRLLGLLGDGHTGLWLKSARVAPVRFFWFDEGLHVVAAERDNESLLGARLIRFGDKPIAEVIAAFEPIVSRDNEMNFKAGLCGLLRVAQFHCGLGLQTGISAVEFTVALPAGGEKTVRLATQLQRDYEDENWTSLPPGAGPLPLSRTHPDEMLWFEPTAAGRVVYAAINGMGNEQGETFTDFTTKLFGHVDQHPEVERLILDFRRNGGGNTFLNRPLIDALCRSRLNRPGGLIVMIGRATFSAAQNTVTEIDRRTAAVFVGEPTGSRPNFIGERVPFNLPYTGHRVSISDLLWVTSCPYDRRMWIEPHLYFPPTLADYLARRDSALEAAIGWQAPPERKIAPVLQ